MALRASLGFALLAAAFVSTVLAAPEPVHDIYSTAYPASYFLLKNFSAPANALTVPAGTVSVSAVANLPGLEELGISNSIFTVAVGGHVTPHYHPRASEILYVRSGYGYVSFITQDTLEGFAVRTNQLIPGDVALVPRGMLHWFKNTGKVPLSVCGNFDAVDTGAYFPNRMFLTMPTDVLAAAFGIKKKVAKLLQSDTNYPFMFQV